MSNFEKIDLICSLIMGIDVIEMQETLEEAISELQEIDERPHLVNNAVQDLKQVYEYLEKANDLLDTVDSDLRDEEWNEEDFDDDEEDGDD